MKHLIVWEDNSCWQQDELEPELQQACIDGLCQIFKVLDGEFEELAVTEPEEWLHVSTNSPYNRKTV